MVFFNHGIFQPKHNLPHFLHPEIFKCEFVTKHMVFFNQMVSLTIWHFAAETQFATFVFNILVFRFYMLSLRILLVLSRDLIRFAKVCFVGFKRFSIWFAA